jgi:hypothetical protein
MRWTLFPVAVSVSLTIGGVTAIACPHILAGRRMAEGDAGIARSQLTGRGVRNRAGS